MSVQTPNLCGCPQPSTQGTLALTCCLTRPSGRSGIRNHHTTRTKSTLPGTTRPWQYLATTLQFLQSSDKRVQEVQANTGRESPLPEAFASPIPNPYLHKLPVVVTRPVKLALIPSSDSTVRKNLKVSRLVTSEPNGTRLQSRCAARCAQGTDVCLPCAARRTSRRMLGSFPGKCIDTQALGNDSADEGLRRRSSPGRRNDSLEIKAEASLRAREWRGWSHGAPTVMNNFCAFRFPAPSAPASHTH